MSHRLPLLALSVLLSLCSVGARATLPDLQRGKQALAAGDLAAARRDLQPLANEGYLEAQLQLAAASARLQTAEGDREALHWYRQALPKVPELKVRIARLIIRQSEPIATNAAADGGEASSARPELRPALDEAEALLREADAAGDPEALLPLLGLLSAYPERDRHPRLNGQALVERAERLQTPEAEAALVRWYRLHQNPAQPQWSAALLRRCKAALARLPECHLDLGRHYRASGDTVALQSLVAEALKRLEAQQLDPLIVERLGQAMVSENTAGAPDSRSAYALLRRVADHSPEARVRLAKLLLEQPELDPAAKPAPLLESAVAEGSQEAALSLARLYLRGGELAVEPAKAEQLLLQAASTEPAAHFALGRLYHRGNLGEAQPVKAVDHYLQAARRGHLRADYALAQLYSENRGVRVDPINAYLFARLAANHAVAEATPLIEALVPRLDAAALAQAQLRLAAELAVRAELQRSPPVAASAPRAPLTQRPAAAVPARAPSPRMEPLLGSARLQRPSASSPASPEQSP